MSVISKGSGITRVGSGFLRDNNGGPLNDDSAAPSITRAGSGFLRCRSGFFNDDDTMPLSRRPKSGFIARADSRSSDHSGFVCAGEVLEGAPSPSSPAHGFQFAEGLDGFRLAEDLDGSHCAQDLCCEGEDRGQAQPAPIWCGPFRGGEHKKVVVLPLAARWYTAVQVGDKNIEVRSASDFWKTRLREVTHVVFQRGFDPKSRLPEKQVLSVDLTSSSRHRELGIPRPGTLEYHELFGDHQELIVVKFESSQSEGNSDSRKRPLAQVDFGFHHGCEAPRLAQAFGWAARFWEAMRSTLGGAELQQSLLGRRVTMSSHCSGIGSAEVAAEMIAAASTNSLGFDVRIDCLSTCDSDRACRRMLSKRSGSCIFNDLFEFFPGWDKTLREPAEMLALLHKHCDVGARRRCQQHGCDCVQPPVTADVCGSPCQPWSRYGSRRGHLVVAHACKNCAEFNAFIWCVSHRIVVEKLRRKRALAFQETRCTLMSGNKQCPTKASCQQPLGGR